MEIIIVVKINKIPFVFIRSDTHCYQYLKLRFQLEVYHFFYIAYLN